MILLTSSLDVSYSLWPLALLSGWFALISGWFSLVHHHCDPITYILQLSAGTGSGGIEEQ